MPDAEGTGNYAMAQFCLKEGDLLNAQVYATLYMGEQIEVATGVLHVVAERLAPKLDSRLREDMPRRKP